jgi:tetratricopeptide (TPR) repeat protein
MRSGSWLTAVQICLLALAVPGTASAASSSDIHEIYSRLARASGDPRRPPQLIELPVNHRAALTSRIAWFDPKGGTIGIDSKLIRLCSEFGERSDDCLALFLGHELAHFYKDHGWGSDFGNRLQPLAVASRIQRQEESAGQILALETQADEAGEIYGYLAGYDTLGIAPEALQKVYGAYRLQKSLRGYPALSERVEIARLSAKRLNELAPVFEAGNLLLVLGRYAEAGRCFEHVVRIFPSREMLNNTGVARALQAAVLLPASSRARQYPWVIENETRLFWPNSNSREAVDPLELLRDAQHWLRQSVERDPAYVPARINLAAVSDLLGQHGSAADEADAAIRLAEQGGTPSFLRQSALLIKTIALEHGGQSEIAARFFAQRALSLGVSPDIWNMFLTGKSAGNESLPSQPATRISPLDGARPTNIRFERPPVRIAGHLGESPLLLRTQPLGKRQALLIMMGQTRLYAITSARHSAAVSTTGLHVGGTLAEVQRICGEGSRYGSSGGSWFACPSQNLVFEFGSDEKVSRWITYEWDR